MSKDKTEKPIKKRGKYNVADRRRNKTTSMRVTPLTKLQITMLMRYTGENASRVMISAIDRLFRSYDLKVTEKVPRNISIQAARPRKDDLR